MVTLPVAFSGKTNVIFESSPTCKSSGIVIFILGVAGLAGALTITKAVVVLDWYLSSPV